MCTTFLAPTERSRLERWTSFPTAVEMPHGQVTPMCSAPILRKSPEAGEGAKEVVAAQYGLLSFWASSPLDGQEHCHAPIEAVASRKVYREAWSKGQRCVVPAECLYRSCTQTGESVRWRIKHCGDSLLGLAGLWSLWRASAGIRLITFTVLTVSAEQEPSMARFAKPNAENRMAVVLDPDDYDHWLGCNGHELMGTVKNCPSEFLRAEVA